ncbi:MAG: hypothetical protein A3I11_07515 [Elusimicrobia bacterium RIFCSPLOWO2_02_FULL_39_32]|nr:MAG: hypothetical protein A2034_00080 [Elusimicrobia bacterium GWA2_38_7]OGR81400.1 MAG: hypothetical protein A3B80_05110 [Elusimicrobia bacterium RIFCSPHIGHO2_02_FULL_39_36]OGR92033.1 MAG: hypothetical protein A3I11_07515 [Elusimicrobia bacterium RIFCSPLOWO2_02_FULL_39_32]OGR98676.1 MAG: hypothetical protein A3G85_04915 [Elusimicrobia bacterium RIFCSPLOWO2_12_FULL_39_28]
MELELEELVFYYNEMCGSNIYELELELPQGKIFLKRISPEQNAVHLKRRRTDFLPETLSSHEPAPLQSLPLNIKVISSPITGIFYQASSPQATPFAKEGEVVNSGATLCIVEAMKVMNEIKAETRVKIVKILAENGKPVSKGQALFHVEPA